jgi:hypothetical protein
MTSAELLADAFERVRQAVHRVVDGLTAEQLTARLDPDANTIAWLIWHLTRIQDDHIADVAGREQCWTANGWVDRFGLPFGRADTGYGHSREDVAAVRVAGGELLTAYYDEVHARTRSFVDAIVDRDLDRVVDESWDPPVTLGVRLVSVINDNLEHACQAEFVRGLVTRR